MQSFTARKRAAEGAEELESYGLVARNTGTTRSQGGNDEAGTLLESYGLVARNTGTTRSQGATRLGGLLFTEGVAEEGAVED